MIRTESIYRTSEKGSRISRTAWTTSTTLAVPFGALVDRGGEAAAKRLRAAAAAAAGQGMVS